MAMTTGAAPAAIGGMGIVGHAMAPIAAPPPVAVGKAMPPVAVGTAIPTIPHNSFGGSPVQIPKTALGPEAASAGRMNRTPPSPELRRKIHNLRKECKMSILVILAIAYVVYNGIGKLFPGLNLLATIKAFFTKEAAKL